MALEIQKNGQTVILRNLQEQVQKNKEDIAKHYAIDRAMSNLGIKIVGQVNSENDLPDSTTYLGEYGNTYAVGDKTLVDAGEATYDYYVFSRPDFNAGITTNYWLNVGKISIEGPQGPVGPEGPQGPKGISTKWYTGAYEPTPSQSFISGDMFLNTNNGQVYTYNGTSWISISNIKGPQGVQGPQGIQGPVGPQGVQGPKGDTGDVGGFINIQGIIENAGQLPTPSILNNLTIAFLVGTNSPYDLYIQVGENSDTAIWNNAGPFNAATLITIGGVGQNVFEYNEYIPLKPGTGENSAIQETCTAAGVNSIALGTNNIANGNSQTVVGKYNVSDSTALFIVGSGTDNDNRASALLVDIDGQVYVPKDPLSDTSVANKKYVDNATKIYRHNITLNLTTGKVRTVIYSTKSTQYTTADFKTTLNQIADSSDTALLAAGHDGNTIVGGIFYNKSGYFGTVDIKTGSGTTSASIIYIVDKVTPV